MNQDDTFHLTSKGFDALQNGEFSSFTDEELLIMRFADGREKRERSDPTVEELDKIVEWYDQLMINQSLLDLVLKGLCYVDLDEDGELLFSLTEEGKRYAKEKNTPREW